MREHLTDSVGKGSAIGLGHECAGLAVDHGLTRTAATVGDDWRPTGLGFDRDDSEILGAREEHDRCLPVELSHLVVGPPPQKPNVGRSRQGAEPRFFGASANNREWNGSVAAGFDGKIHAFVGDER